MIWSNGQGSGWKGERAKGVKRLEIKVKGKNHYVYDPPTLWGKVINYINAVVPGKALPKQSAVAFRASIRPPKS